MDETGESLKPGSMGTHDSTPNSKIDSKGPPSTPYKRRRVKSTPGDVARRNMYGSAVRSLTPLFNGFSAAQQRASQLGGRYGTIARRSLNGKKKRSDTRKVDGAVEEGSRKKRLEVQGGVCKVGRSDIVRDDGSSRLSIQTAPLVNERRILEFNAIVGADAPETKADDT